MEDTLLGLGHIIEKKTEAVPPVMEFKLKQERYETMKLLNHLFNWNHDMLGKGVQKTG